MWQEPKLNWTEDDYYNAEDLNRVEMNTNEVALLIKQLIGLDVGLEELVTDRDYKRIEFADSLNRIERNLERLSVLNLPGIRQLKTNWQTLDPFDYRDATRLETNLSILYGILIKNTTTVNYTGMFYCGEVVI